VKQIRSGICDGRSDLNMEIWFRKSFSIHLRVHKSPGIIFQVLAPSPIWHIS